MVRLDGVMVSMSVLHTGKDLDLIPGVSEDRGKLFRRWIPSQQLSEYTRWSD